MDPALQYRSSQHKSSRNDREHPHAHLYRTLIELGGGRYAGVQAGFLDKNRKPVAPLVLFTSPQTGSTLGLSAFDLSANAVRAKIIESDLAFNAFADKATTFVLRHFAAKPVVTSQVSA